MRIFASILAATATVIVASAAQAFCVPMTCGSTAGYLTPLLRSESQADPIQRISTFRRRMFAEPSGFQSGECSGAGRKLVGVDAQTMKHRQV